MPLLKLFWLSLFAAGSFCVMPAAHSGMPDKLDEKLLLSQLEGNGGKAPLEKEDRVWTLAALGRLRVIQNRPAEAEIFFAKAGVEAWGQQSDLKLTVTQLALDLLAQNAAALGDWKRFDELASGFQPYTMKGGLKLLRPALALGYCLRLANKDCLKRANDEFAQALGAINGPVWGEDIYALRTLARIVSDCGFGAWGAELLLRFVNSAQLSDEEKVRALLAGVNFGLEDYAVFPFFTDMLQRARAIVNGWKVDEADQPDNASELRLNLRNTLRRWLTVLETRAYQFLGSPSAEEIWRRIDGVAGLEDYKDSELSEQEWWSTQQFLASDGRLQRALEQAESRDLGYTIAENFAKRSYLLASAPALATTPLGQGFARAYSASIPADAPTRRVDLYQAVALLRETGLFSEAFTRQAEIVGPLVSIAEAGGPVSAVLFSRLVDATDLAMRSNEAETLLKARRLTVRASAAIAENADMQALLAVLDAAALPSQLPPSIRAVDMVLASPSLTPDTKAVLLWALARGQAKHPAAGADGWLAKIENAHILGADFLPYSVRLVRLNLSIELHHQAETAALRQTVELESYATRDVPELVIAAALLQRSNKTPLATGDEPALCAIRALYLQAGAPATSWFQLQPGERGVLDYRPALGTSDPCPQRAQTAHLERLRLQALSATTGTAYAAPKLSADVARRVLEIVLLPPGAPERMRLMDQMADAFDALKSRKDRVLAYRAWLYEFDRLGLPFAPEALHLCSRALMAPGASHGLIDSATERLAIADALGILGGAARVDTQDTAVERLHSVTPEELKFNASGSASRMASVHRKGSRQQSDDGSLALAESYLVPLIRTLSSSPAKAPCTSEQTETLGRVDVILRNVPATNRSVRFLYRLAQAKLFCLLPDEADRAFSDAINSLPEGDLDRVRLLSYWAADNASVHYTARASAAATKAIDAYTQFSADADSPYSSSAGQDRPQEVVTASLVALASAKLFPQAHALSQIAYSQMCEAQRIRPNCSGISRMKLLTTYIDASDSDLAAALGDSVKAADAETSLEIAGLATFAAKKSAMHGDAITARKFLADAEAAFAARAGTMSSTDDSEKMIELAAAHACAGDWQSSIKRAKAVKATFYDPWLAWDTRKLDDERLSAKAQAFARAYRLAALESVFDSNRRARQAWRKASMPTLRQQAQVSAHISLSARVYALFLVGYRSEGLMLLQKNRPQFLKEMSALSDSRFPAALATQLAGLERENLQHYGKLIEAFMQTKFGRDGSVVQAVALRLRAAIENMAGHPSAALESLVAASAVENASKNADSNPPNETIQAETLVERNLAGFVIEDLAAVLGRSPHMEEFGQDDLTAAHRSLRRSQRPMLALLIMQHGSGMIADARGRQDLAFKIMQVAAAGPTALEMLATLQRAGIAEPRLRDALRIVQREEEKQRERLRSAPPWAKIVDFQERRVGSLACPVAPVVRNATVMQSAMAQLPAELGRPVGFPRLPHDYDYENSAKDRERLEAALKTTGEAKGGLVQLTSAPADLSTVLSGLSSTKAVFMAVTETDATYAALITKAGLTMFSTVGAARPLGEKAASEMVAEVRKRLEPGAVLNLPQAGDPLYHALFDPVNEQLKNIEEVAIIVRGPLEALPFSALAIGGMAETHTGPKWFDDRFVWSFAIAVDRRRAARAYDNGSAAVVQFGPPDFAGGPDCAKPILAGDASNNDLHSRMCGIDQLAGLNESLEDAPDTKRARMILTGQAATKGRLMAMGRSTTPNDATVIIVATHGLTASETEALSGLREPAILLASSAVGDQRESVVLASEIANMNLNAREVVLAVCNSTSPAADTDEIAFSGLVRAFVMAGAERVVAAMSAINSDTTQLALQHYFKERSAGADAAHALSSARGMLRKAGLDEPAYWAGLVAIGGY